MGWMWSWVGAGRWLALGAAALMAGCATAPPAVFTLTVSPRVEALSYFPSSSPVVALVKTDPGDGQWKALAASGLLREVERAGKERGLLIVQMRRLLGHDLVLG